MPSTTRRAAMAQPTIAPQKPGDADNASVRPLRDFDIQLARVRMTQFVVDKAKETEQRLDFTFEPVVNAPETYSQLRAAFARSQRTGEPLPVSKLHCASTTFLTPKHNVMFRFWHDVSHVERGLSFVHSCELELALWHLREFERAGFMRDSLAYKLFEADTVGALMVKAITKRYPYSQLRFAIGCAQNGLLSGVQLELGRVPSLADLDFGATHTEHEPCHE